MTTALPQKIILKNATGMSLNDRFSQLDRAGVRVQISSQRQANAKTQRFARQMANRQLIVPSIPNKQSTSPQMVQTVGRTSALLRLGDKVGRARGSWPWRGVRRGGRIFGASRGRSFVSTQYQQSFTRGRRGWRGRGAASPRAVAAQAATSNTTYMYFRGRGRGRFGSRRGGRGRGFVTGSRGYYGNVTSGRGGRRGWGRGWRGRQPANRQQLDAQLDQYMTSADD